MTRGDGPHFDEATRALIDAALDAVVVIGADGAVIEWSRGAERVFGWQRDEAIGRCVAELIVPERYRAAHLAGLEQFRLTGEGPVLGKRLELEAVRRDGTEFPVELAITRVTTPTGFVASAFLRDITDRKADEEDLESFRNAVAHDLRKPLRAMSGFGQALLREQAALLSEDAVRHLRYIAESAEEMGRLLEDLERLSQLSRTKVRHEQVDLSAAATAAAAEMQQASPDRQVEVVIESGLEATGDPRLLGTALRELIGNAWKFTRPRAYPRIEFGAVAAGAGRTFFVRDNGVGFDMAHAGKLFGIFERLHHIEEFGGSGIGLARVQRIIRRHGGRVWAESEPDRGATFYFTLAGPPAAG